MPAPSLVDLARQYCVDDLPNATMPRSWLRPILEALHAGALITPMKLRYLTEEKLHVLHSLATGSLTPEDFRPLALAEQEVRVREAQRLAEAEAATRLPREAMMALAAQRRAETEAAKRLQEEEALKAYLAARAADPNLRAQDEAEELRRQFGLSSIGPDLYPRLMPILERVRAGRRLSAEDVVWLSADAKECWSPELRKAHHRLEAEALTAEWRQTGDLWAAVTASGHWRKAEAPSRALEVTEAAATEDQLAPKLRSALCTTRGGAMRDLRRLCEALELGQQAQRLAPGDYRPCTLLGAVHIECGDYTAGMEWYERANQLGATRQAVDQDLRSILARASSGEREKLRSFLLSRDEDRFAWVRGLKGRPDPVARH